MRRIWRFCDWEFCVGFGVGVLVGTYSSVGWRCRCWCVESGRRGSGVDNGLDTKNEILWLQA